MICITEAQLNAALLELEVDWRTCPDKATAMAEWDAMAPEECARIQTERTLELLKKHGAKQKIE